MSITLRMCFLLEDEPDLSRWNQIQHLEQDRWWPSRDSAIRSKKSYGEQRWCLCIFLKARSVVVNSDLSRELFIGPIKLTSKLVLVYPLQMHPGRRLEVQPWFSNGDSLQRTSARLWIFLLCCYKRTPGARNFIQNRSFSYTSWFRRHKSMLLASARLYHTIAEGTMAESCLRGRGHMTESVARVLVYWVVLLCNNASHEAVFNLFKGKDPMTLLPPTRPSPLKICWFFIWSIWRPSLQHIESLSNPGLVAFPSLRLSLSLKWKVH